MRAVEIVGATVLVAVIGIDLLDLSDEFADSPAIGIGYIAFIGGSFAAVGLIAQHDRRGWWLASGLSLAAITAFTLNRTVGIPAAAHGVNAWSGPLGIAVAIAEVTVAVLAATALHASAVALKSSMTTTNKRKQAQP